MWKFLRPDAVEILEDKRVQKSLARYFSVMFDKKPAKYMITRRFPTGIDFSATTENLWKAHDDLIKDFEKIQKQVDEGKLSLDQLEPGKVSLLDLKIEIAKRILKNCHFCERRCGVDRTAGKKGFCQAGVEARIASEFLHHGEEPELVPSYTIFFCGCSFYCIHCQNWTISRWVEPGWPATPQDIAKMVDKRRHEGARNVNWVGGSPTPNLHNILESLKYFRVNIPSVWNSNMYMSEEAMKLLHGTVDVYLTDLKYGNSECALKLSKVKSYWEIATRNHIIASRQAELIIRQLVLPGHLECCTKPALSWIAKNLGPDVRTNVLFQYRPEFKAYEYEGMNRRLTMQEIKRAMEFANEAGLKNLLF
ncbi:MAG: radical SAM protein [Euryarchaeota archaeon]|nr:radical SAM protein [Euryarchaeota archaeon]